METVSGDDFENNQWAIWFVREEQLGIRIIVGQEVEEICAESLESKQKLLWKEFGQKALVLHVMGRHNFCPCTCYPLKRLRWNFIHQMLWRVIFLLFSATWYWSRCCSKLFANVRNTWALGSDLQKCWHSYLKSKAASFEHEVPHNL